MVSEHYERDFDMIFPFKGKVLNLVFEHYERDFDMIFHFKPAQNLVAEIFYMIFNLRRRKISLQSTMK